MRPKKKVLLVDADENRLSILRMLLETHRYAVRGVSNSAEAMTEGADWDPDLVIVSTPLPCVDLAKLFADFTSVIPAASTLLLTHQSLILNTGHAHATLRPTVRSAELLERVKILVARKRGPRKCPVQSAVSGAVSRRTA